MGFLCWINFPLTSVFFFFFFFFFSFLLFSFLFFSFLFLDFKSKKKKKQIILEFNDDKKKFTKKIQLFYTFKVVVGDKEEETCGKS